jgi:hypothetical protein
VSNITETLGDPSEGLNEIFDLANLNEDAVIAALDEWQQGDVVSGIRMFWAAGSGLDPLNGIELEEPGDGGWQVARYSIDEIVGKNLDSVDQVPALGIITSQTCDIAATGPGSRHPVVQISPLVRLDQLNPARATAIRQNSSLDMVLVTNIDVPGEWAADLRISMPVSKTYLLSQSPARAFASANEAHSFSERVAAKIRRPALHEGISSHLIDSLRDFVQRNRTSGAAWMDRIEQFRVSVKEGEPLHPQEVEIIVVILDQPFSAEEANALRQWRLNERRQFSNACDGANLVPLRFLPLGTIKVQDYRESFPMRVPELGQQSFW